MSAVSQSSEVLDLITQSWRMIDMDGGVGVEELFAEDGTLAFGASVHRGRAKIAGIYRARRARGVRTSRHVITNLLMERNGDGVRAGYVMTLFAADGPPVSAATTPIAIMDVVDEIDTTDPSSPILTSRSMWNVFRSPDEALAVPYGERNTTPSSQLSERPIYGKLYGRVVTWDELPTEEARAGITRKAYTTDAVQMVLNVCNRDMALNPHSHDDFDQLVMILRGRAIYHVHGVGHEMGPGSMMLVPAGAVHYIEPLEDDVHNLDVFVPPRGDLLHLTEPFLRGLAK